MNRRELLLATLVTSLQRTKPRSSQANVRIMEAAWQGARDQFYDPTMRGVDWDAVRIEFLPKVQACSSDDELISILRQMLSRLRNSHIFLYTDEEWEWRRNIIPVCFGEADGHLFVRYVLHLKDSESLVPLKIGDEIISVDGIPAKRLRPLTLARLENVKGNPNFGPPDSVAKVEVRRAGDRQVVNVKRVVRPRDFEAVVAEHTVADTLLLRFFTLGSREIPPGRLRRLWEKVMVAKGLILDLRNCVGGDSEVSNFIAGSLLGPGKPLFRMIPRKGVEVLDHSDEEARRFRGPVALITDSNTESQPEVLAVLCREYGRGRIFGERTAGAFNGWTVSIDLPGNFAFFAIPFTRSVSPKGVEYEGRGIDPDEPVSNQATDFEQGRDLPLVAATKYLNRGVAHQNSQSL